MCFDLTCENTNKRVSAVNLIETFATNGAQVENQTHDLRITSATTVQSSGNKWT
jgi:hypothetical protein